MMVVPKDRFQEWLEEGLRDKAQAMATAKQFVLKAAGTVVAKTIAMTVMVNIKATWNAVGITDDTKFTTTIGYTFATFVVVPILLWVVNSKK